MLKPLVDGEWIPFGWAIAFYDPIDDVYWIAPCGVHWLVRFVRRCWEQMARYQMSAWEAEMRARSDAYLYEITRELNDAEVHG
jgi:hypothetical protein